MLNKAMIIGNLCADPEIKYTANGSAVATLSVATNRRWKDKDGKQQEGVEFHRVQVWNKTAEFCGKYLQKGNKVYADGRISTRKWKDQNGNDRYTTEIVADSVQNLSPRSGEQQDGPPEPSDQSGYGGGIGTGPDVPFMACY